MTSSALHHTAPTMGADGAASAAGANAARAERKEEYNTARLPLRVAADAASVASAALLVAPLITMVDR